MFLILAPGDFPFNFKHGERLKRLFYYISLAFHLGARKREVGAGFAIDLGLDVVQCHAFPRALGILCETSLSLKLLE